MPSLLETQRAIARAFLASDTTQAWSAIVANGLAPERRLAVYHHTFASVLTNALRIAFPAVHRLVGDAFFAGAAWQYLHAHPPKSAWLDEYGMAFPAFLASLPSAGEVPYLVDVARLECAINRALHAPDESPIDVVALSRVRADDRGRIAFVAHPSVDVVACRYPADSIWRAVLARDDDALAALDIRPDPVVLLVARCVGRVDVTRVPLAQARLTVELLAGVALDDAIASSDECDADAVLAEHLALDRFSAFRVLRSLAGAGDAA